MTFILNSVSLNLESLEVILEIEFINFILPVRTACFGLILNLNLQNVLYCISVLFILGNYCFVCILSPLPYRYEEENFVRMTNSKQEKKKQRISSGFNSLLNFDDEEVIHHGVKLGPLLRVLQ